MKNKFNVVLFLVVLFLLFSIEPAIAGPGGYVVKALFKTFWGKILLTIIAIILLPLILYVRFREYFGVRKTKKQLQALGKINKDFTWLTLDKTVRLIFQRVYIAWNNEKMNEVSELVSPWYWQNQQLTILDQWKKENLRNICSVEKITKVRPLYMEIRENQNFEGSRIAFSIEAKIKDYLIDRETYKIVKGKNDYGHEEKVWILEYDGDKWLLDDIQEDTLTLAFAKMENIIPEKYLSETLKKEPQKA